jgi:steroid 5-alpha reductase family enzyme
MDGLMAGLATTAALALATWVASTLRQDVSYVDRTWSLMILGAALAYSLHVEEPPPRAWALLMLVAVWAGRLSFYVTRRNWGHGEDRRYQRIRANHQPRFALKSLYLVFGLQAVLAWVVSWPALAALKGDLPNGPLDFLAAALAAFGIVFEAVGDAQMARFKADPSHKGQVMDRGLWRYTRHPNYFGEACTWWGLGLLGIAGGGGWWALASPVLMTFLLLKVSGVTMLEADIGERRPAYAEYIRRTNAFIPGPPRP